MNIKIKRILVLASIAFFSLFFLSNVKNINAAAQSAKTKLTSVVVTNWPELFKVREQNLDNNGNIKVHEQGTVNVNVENSDPIPVVNVSSSNSTQNWEYTAQCFTSQDSYLNTLPARLNEKANQGWELVTASGGNTYCEYWKRPIAN